MEIVCDNLHSGPRLAKAMFFVHKKYSTVCLFFFKTFCKTPHDLQTVCKSWRIDLILFCLRTARNKYVGKRLAHIYVYTFCPQGVRASLCRYFMQKRPNTSLFSPQTVCDHLRRCCFLCVQTVCNKSACFAKGRQTFARFVNNSQKCVLSLSGKRNIQFVCARGSGRFVLS